MTRVGVYQAINSERDYQDRETAKPSRPDMVEDFDIAAALTALQVNLRSAQDVWYGDSPNYQATMHYIRKLAGICVKAGEKYGMPSRPQ